jgi:hypothetical protein
LARSSTDVVAALRRDSRPTMLVDVLNPARDAQHLTLGEDTAGAVEVAACRTAGISDRRLHQLVQTGRWQSPFPRVYVTFSGPIPLPTMLYAALMYAGERSTLSHASAGRCWRVCREPDVIHLTVPYDRQVDHQERLAIHRSRTLTEVDIHPTFRPRRTTIERTVVDLLGGCKDADAALGLVADSFRDRLSSPGKLRLTLERLPQTRWRRVVLDALPDLQAGAQSPLELRDARLRRVHGLPSGRRQAWRLADGAEFLDILIEEWQLHVELDGRFGHDRAQERWRDMKRDNRSEILQLRELRYGWADMIDQPCEVAIQQAVILRQQGWPGGFTRCPACPPTLPPDL